MNAYQLAHLAEVSSPDSLESPGARFLVRVSEAYQDAREDGYEDASDRFHELADSLVPVYTHERMLTLVDLGAYNEDISEYTESGDIVEIAGVALYLVAERLLHELHADAENSDEDDD